MTPARALQSFRKALRSGVGWWLGTLAGMLPARIREAFAAPPPEIVLDISPQRLILRKQDAAIEAEIADPARIADLIAGTVARSSVSGTALVLLSEDLVFRRVLTVPPGGSDDLHAMLVHEIDRLTPLDAASACHDARMLGELQDGMARAELLVAERPLIEAILHGLRQAAIRPLRVGLGSEPTEPIDLARSFAAPIRQWWRPQPLPLLIGMSLIAFGFAVFLALDRRDNAVEKARQEAGQLRAAARQVDALAREVAALEARAAGVAAERARPGPLLVLGDLARRLPDDSFLAALSLNQKELRLSGWSKDASRLPPLLDDSPQLEALRFGAPLTRDGAAGLDRFELTATLTPGARP